MRTISVVVGAADAREMVKLLYEFERPMVLDGGKFVHAHPQFRYMPHLEAASRTLTWFRA